MTQGSAVGVALPPLEFTVALLAGTLVVTALLYALEPPINQRTVVALTPWMALGGALHAFLCHRLKRTAPVVTPLFGAPAVILRRSPLGVAGSRRCVTARRGHSVAAPRTAPLSSSDSTVLLVIAVARQWSRPAGAYLANYRCHRRDCRHRGDGAAVARWRTPVAVGRYGAPIGRVRAQGDDVSNCGGVVSSVTLGTTPRVESHRVAGTLPTAPYLGKAGCSCSSSCLWRLGSSSCWMTILKTIPSKRASARGRDGRGIGSATNNIVRVRAAG